MRDWSLAFPLLICVIAVVAAITGAASATEGGLGELISEIMDSHGAAAVRASSGPLNADVALITDRGYVTSLADTGGQVRLVSLVYAHCPGMCPQTVQTIQALEGQLGARQAAHLGVLLLSLDPTDTPEALRGFATEHAISSYRWTVAKALRPADTDALAERLNVQHRRLSDGSIDHSGSIALVDSQGRILTQTSETATVDAAFAAAVRDALGRADRS